MRCTDAASRIISTAERTADGIPAPCDQLVKDVTQRCVYTATILLFRLGVHLSIAAGADELHCGMQHHGMHTV